MNKHLGFAMQRLFGFAACILLLPTISAAQSIGGTPFLAVHGSARIEVVPDVFPVSVDVQEVGMDLPKSQALVEDLTQAVLAKARALALADKDIYIGDLSVSPQQDYDATTRKSVFRGNNYRRSLLFKFRSLADLKQFLAGMPTGKQVSVRLLAFECSTANEIRRRLLIDAIADARRTADILATGIGRRVTIAQTISTSPMALSAGSYINAIDVASVESTTVLTSEQIAKIPAPRSITSVALLAPGTVKSDIVLEKGSVELDSDVYIVYLLGD